MIEVLNIFDQDDKMMLSCENGIGLELAGSVRPLRGKAELEKKKLRGFHPDFVERKNN